MELNLKKNLFRYGQNESLTSGVILALILFDLLIWSVISAGMISVDYRFADQNSCKAQVSHILSSNLTSLPHYTPKTGKYCANLQELYNKTQQDPSVMTALDQIAQTQSQIHKLEETINRTRRELEKNSDAYTLAIQERKGLDLSYTEKLAQIQSQEKTLAQLEHNLQQEQTNFRALSAIQKLKSHALKLVPDIATRYSFMQKLDLFLCYVFEMLFILILIPVFMIFRHRLARKEKYIRLLLVNHVILVAVLQGISVTVGFILDILPKTLLYHLVQIFRSLHIMALWYYIVILLLFVLFAAVVYFLQTKGKRRNLYKKLIKGKCWSCGARVLDNEYCFSCGEKQLRTCPHCHKKTYIKMPHCRFCGHALKDN